MNSITQRLDKYLANKGVVSRRKVEALLDEQMLTVNGKRVTEPGTRVNPLTDDVRLSGNKLPSPDLVYFLVNKPKGTISTVSDEFNRKNVMSLVPRADGLHPVGRLDKDTSGLIILTNDGELTNLLTHPRYDIDKTYRLTIGGKLNSNQLASLRHGVKLDEGMTEPANVVVVSKSTAKTVVDMTIHEGKNRQIRRMCGTVGVNLRSLTRIKLGFLEIGAVSEGNYRKLTQREVDILKKSVQQ